MPQGKKLDRDLKRLIRRAYSDNPNSPRRVIRDEVQSSLRKDPKYESILSKDPEWPSLTSVHKVVHDYEEYLETLSGRKELPWSLAEMAHASVHPEALPVIVRQWAACLRDGERLTVRQAEWMGRLFQLYREGPELFEAAQVLAEWEVGQEVEMERSTTDEGLYYYWLSDYSALKQVSDDRDLLRAVAGRIHALNPRGPLVDDPRVFD